MTSGGPAVAAEGPVDAVAALYAAILTGDVERIIDRYERDGGLTVFVEGPRWLTVGFEAVARGWRAFDAAPFTLTGIEVIDGPHVCCGDDMAVVAQIVHLTAQAGVGAGADVRRLRMRMTHVMRLGTDGRWRTVHEHASQPLADPYGSGDWLSPGENI